MGDISAKQQRIEKFCQKFSECSNASEAYRYAYPKSTNWKDETVWVKASHLLSTDTVQTRVKELQSEMAEKSLVTKERVLKELMKIGFSSIAYMHNTWIDRVEFERLTEDQKACIKSIQTKIERRVIDWELRNIEMVKIELYDKLTALNSINKMLGFDAPTNVNINTDLTQMSTEELERRKREYGNH